MFKVHGTKYTVHQRQDFMPNGGGPAIQTAKRGQIEWVMVRKNDRKTLNDLRRKFDFHPIDLQDAAPPLQSHKLSVRDDYLFMILQYPVFDRTSKIIHTAELDFFIGSNFLVTVDADGLDTLQKSFSSFAKDDKASPTCLAADIPQLLYQVLDEMTLSILPMLRHMSADVEDIETRLFGKFKRDLIKELLRVKTNIVNVRKAMQGHKTVMRKLIEQSHQRFPGVGTLEDYFDKLINTTKDIWDALELQKDTINALHETNVSLLDYQTNDVMKTLTIMSVLTFPLTLIATLFATRLHGMPLSENLYGFWILLSILLSLACIMLWYFKKRDWL